MAQNDESNIRELDLESAMKRLDETVEALSGDGVSLEEALALYEKGVALVRQCSERLENAQRRINIIRMSEDGELSEEPFEGGAE